MEIPKKLQGGVMMIQKSLNSIRRWWEEAGGGWGGVSGQGAGRGRWDR